MRFAIALFVMGALVTGGAQDLQAPDLPELLKLKIDNVQLTEALLGRDVDRCLASVNYQARVKDLQEKWAVLEPEAITALGGNVITHTLDRQTLTLIAKEVK